MKKLKKVLALVLAMTMILAMGVTALATENTETPTEPSATITIDGAGDEAKFIYTQVIKSDTTKATGWTICDTGFGNALKESLNTDDEQTIIKILINYAAEQNGESAVYEGIEVPSEFAGKYIDALLHALDDVGTNTAVELQDSKITVYSEGVYAIMGYEKGFAYSPMAAYIGFGEGSLVGSELKAKREPVEQKDIKSTDDSDHVTQIGDVISYEVASVIPYFTDDETDRTYIFVDKVTGGEYVEGSIRVYLYGINDNDEEYSLGEGNATDGRIPNTYIDIENGGDTAEYTQKLTINLSDYLEIKENTFANLKVVVTYDVTVIGTVVNNKVVLGKADSEGKFEEDSTASTGEVELYTGKITLTKKENEDDETGLSEAEFKVYRVDKDGNLVGEALKFTQDGDGNYTYDPDSKEKDADIIVVDENGVVVVNGLDLGKYHFEEVKAPAGYSINADGTDVELALAEGETEATGIVEKDGVMLDTKLSSLPSTGGIGTTLFTIGGIILMVGAAGMYFVSKKKKA